MKIEFLEVSTITGGKSVINRTSIALMEKNGNGTKFTLNINDSTGKPIVILTTESYEEFSRMLSKS